MPVWTLKLLRGSGLEGERDAHTMSRDRLAGTLKYLGDDECHILDRQRIRIRKKGILPSEIGCSSAEVSRSYDAQKRSLVLRDDENPDDGIG